MHIQLRTKATRALQIAGEQEPESWDYYAMTFFRKVSDVSTRAKTSGESVSVSDCPKTNYHMRTKTETFFYYGRPFVTDPVETESYVWHLTRESKRSNIAKEGILPIYGLVFANNINDDITCMWHWDTEMECWDGDHLDYWRIDVRKAGARWYNDYNLDYEKACGRYV